MTSITKELLHSLFHYNPETGVIVCKRSAKVMGTQSSEGYVLVSIRPDRVITTSMMAHRIAWLYMGNAESKIIDHINRIRNDNRIANLRSATESQNAQNTPLRPDNKSGFRGVYWDKSQGKWGAYVYHKNKQYRGGFFDDKEAAAASAQALRRKYFTHESV